MPEPHMTDRFIDSIRRGRGEAETKLSGLFTICEE